ncbi:MAG: hypothetical protein ACRCZB_05355 [Bacteroidales bacterium]
MKYDRILIDVSNLYYRAYKTSSNLTAEVDGELLVTGGIYTVITMIKKIRREYLSEGGRIFYLFDNASSNCRRRKEADPDYKAHRIAQDPVFYRGLDYLYLVLQVLNDNDRIIRRPLSEADDLVRPVITSFGSKDYKVLLISTDLDWARSITDSVHWLVNEGKTSTIYTKELFKNKYGFTPTVESVCFYKSIRGDSSDNIPVGVKNVREEMLLDLITRAETLDNFYFNIKNWGLTDKWENDFLLNKGRVFINYSLVQFQNLTVDETREYTEITKFNSSVLGVLFRALKFNASKLDDRLRLEEKEVLTEDFFSEERLPRA